MPAPSSNLKPEPVPSGAGEHLTGQSLSTSTQPDVRASAAPDTKGPIAGQKLLGNADLKGTPKISSDPEQALLKHERKQPRSLRKDVKSTYEVKQKSTNPNTQAEVRAAQFMEANGYKIHFRGIDKGADLYMDDVRTEVKLPKGKDITSVLNSAGQQKVPWVIVDGTQKNITQGQVDASITKFLDQAKDFKSHRNVKIIFVMLGDGSLYIRHLDTSLTVPSRR